jgi:NAD(P)-dependent dehydrogenase (short-subunit alcohol dehydrogenase family)
MATPTRQDQKKFSSKLADTNILITGGTSGIGFGVAEALLEQSPPPRNIILSSSNPERVAGAIERLKAAYPVASTRTKLTGITCDLSDPETIEVNVKKLFESLPLGKGEKLDHIVHSAGDRPITPGLKEIDMSLITRAGLVRFAAPVLIAKHALPYLGPGPQTSLTITGGGVSERPMPNWALLSGYASGLHGLVKGLSLDMKPVRVNLVQPGATATEMWGNMGWSEEQTRGMLDHLASSLATGTVGKVEDVAECYLACMRDRNMTGNVVKSDGGGLFL